jgi:hopanoid biosynthesis associated protein HpnK
LKQLIVTGDDFGRSHKVNEAIERCHEAGFLTQASLMVNEPFAEEALQIARRHPTLCVGLHLTLCDGRGSAVSKLTDHTGRLHSSPAWAGLRYVFAPWLKGALHAEIRAQFGRFLSSNLPATYWDGHTHLHLHPIIFHHALAVAVEHGFRAMRLVREPGPPALLPTIFERLSRNAAVRLQEAGMTSADFTFGLRETGKITTGVAARILRDLPDGLSEFYFHPGAEPEALDLPRLCELIAEREIKLRNSQPLQSAR